MTALWEQTSPPGDLQSLGLSWGTSSGAMKRGANELMRASLGHWGVSDPIPFFCECSRRRCYQPVWLTSTEYDARRLDPLEPILYQDHEAPTRALLFAPTDREN